MSRFLVYGLTDPRTGQIRYIGKSTTGMLRPRGHAKPSYLRQNCHRTNWLKQLISEGLTYGITVICHCESAEELSEAEKHWIWRGRSMGWPLTNMTDGGDGIVGYRYSEEQKKRMSEAAKRRPRSHYASARRRVYTPDGLEKLRRVRALKRGTKRPPMSAEQKDKIAATWTEERKAALAERNRKADWTDEMRAKSSASAKKRGLNCATKQITFLGITQSIADWSRMSGIPYPKLRHRLVDSKWDLSRSLEACQ